MPRVSPEPGRNIRLCQLWSLLQKLVKELLAATVEEWLLWRVVDIEDLEDEAEEDGDKDEKVHLHPLVAQGHALAEALEGGHPALVDLGLNPHRELHLLLLEAVHGRDGEGRLWTVPPPALVWAAASDEGEQARRGPASSSSTDSRSSLHSGSARPLLIPAPHRALHDCQPASDTTIMQIQCSTAAKYCVIFKRIKNCLTL